MKIKTVSQDDFAKFKFFYDQLYNKENIFYMYFSSNLLHYVVEANKLIPSDVNIVLVGSCLTEDEAEFINKYLKKPFCSLSGRYREGPIWDLLVGVSEKNFGWIDIDCFIFNSDIFYELSKINNNDAINAVWYRNYYNEYGINENFASTYIQFLNVDIINKIKKSHRFTMLALGYPGYCNSINESSMDDKEEDFIKQKYPDTVKRTVDYIDTTHYYQILAIESGYKINLIRDLTKRKNYHSYEAIHLGEAHNLHRTLLNYDEGRIHKRFNKRFSYYLLYKNLNILPEQYISFEQEFRLNLIENKLTTDILEIRQKINSYLNRFEIDINLLDL